MALSPGLAAPLLAAEDPAPVSIPWLVGSLTLNTLLFVAGSAFVWWARQAILLRLKQLAVEKTRHIASPNLRRVSARRIIQLARIGTRLASIALLLVGAFVWVTLVLEVMPGTRTLASRIEHLVFGEVEALALVALGAIPNLGVLALLFFATRMVHEMLNHYFRSITAGEITSSVFDPVTAETTRRLADLGVWIAAIIIAYPYIPGSESPAFRGVSVLAGLMLSLGSANFVGQFASGLSLIYGRFIRPGEYIETGAIEGTVEHIGVFACTLRTSRDEVVVLPHTVVAAGLKNFSRGTGGVRYVATVTIGYDAPWRQVRDLLLAAAARTEGVRSEPAPNVLQVALEDFYVRYELRFTPVDPRDHAATLGRLHAEIQDQFQAAGVQIMSPHYLGDPASPKIPPAATGG